MGNIKLSISNWLEERYRTLCGKFGKGEFTLDEAGAALGDISKDEASTVLSELRRAGRADIGFAEDDKRKHIYKMKLWEDIIDETLKTDGKKLSEDEFEKLLQNAAILLEEDADQNVILFVLFYKTIIKAAYNIPDDGTPQKKKGVFEKIFGRSSDFWEKLKEEDPFSLTSVSKALDYLKNNSVLGGLYKLVDFDGAVKNPHNAQILRRVIEALNSNEEILSAMYDRALRLFSFMPSSERKKTGEFYTPKPVTRLLAELLKPESKDKIYDPAIGSGGILIGAYDYVNEKEGEEAAKKLCIYGQDIDANALHLAQTNFYSYGIKNLSLEEGDTLLNPAFKDEEGIQKFDMVISNVPFNLKYDEEDLKAAPFSEERFSYGYPTKMSADWAWLQHIAASLDDKKGKAAVITSSRSLMRVTPKDKSIRENFVNADIIEAVIAVSDDGGFIAVPFFIVVFNKNKSALRKGKILFIDAPEENKMFGKEEKLKKVISVYDGFEEIKGFSRAASTEGIKEKDFILDPVMYIKRAEDEKIDIQKEWQELREIEKELSESEQKLEECIKGIK